MLPIYLLLGFTTWISFGILHVWYWRKNDRVYAIDNKAWLSYVVVFFGPIGILAEITGSLIVQILKGRLPQSEVWWAKRHFVVIQAGAADIFLAGITNLYWTVRLFRNMGIPDEIIDHFIVGAELLEIQASELPEWPSKRPQLEEKLRQISETGAGDDLPSKERWARVRKRCGLEECYDTLTKAINGTGKILKGISSIQPRDDALKSITEGIKNLSKWIVDLQFDGENVRDTIDGILHGDI